MGAERGAEAVLRTTEVHSLAEHAAFSCEGTTSFFIDAARQEIWIFLDFGRS